MSAARGTTSLAAPQPFPPRPLHELQAEWRARVVGEEPLAQDWEHVRLYEALERTAQLAEIAGHDDLARDLRDRRRAVWSELAAGSCEVRRR